MVLYFVLTKIDDSTTLLTGRDAASPRGTPQTLRYDAASIIEISCFTEPFLQSRCARISRQSVNNGHYFVLPDWTPYEKAYNIFAASSPTSTPYEPCIVIDAPDY